MVRACEEVPSQALSEITVSEALSGSGIVLALGGGGTRGLAHLGVLAELEEAGVAVRGIAGTSSGAMLGAMWLVLGSAAAIERVRAFVRSGLARRMLDIGSDNRGAGVAGLIHQVRYAVAMARAVATRHVLTQQELLRRVDFLVPEGRVEALRTPLIVVATDSATGDEVRIDRGPLRLAIAASSAMPGLVAPFAMDGRRLQDGGAVAEIPVGAARAIGSPVVAVEVSERMPVAHPDSDRLPRAMFRAAAMGWRALRLRLLAEADALIAPEVNHLHWADYHALDEAVEAGRIAARAFLARSV
jgi:NTE family protein